MPVPPNYPGVYIQELAGADSTIQGVPTSIALFVGRTNWGPLHTALPCSSYADFQVNFGTDTLPGEMALAISLFFSNGGNRCYVYRIGAGNLASAAANCQAFTITAKFPGTAGNQVKVDIIQRQMPGNFDLSICRLYLDAAGREHQTNVESWINLGCSPGPRYYADVVKSALVDITVGEDCLPDPGTLTLSGGEDGDPPTADDYRSAFLEKIDEQVNLFNLLIMPNDPGVTDTHTRLDILAEGNAFCSKRRAFQILDSPVEWGKDVLVITGETGIVALRAALPALSNAAVFHPWVIPADGNKEKAVGSAGAIAGLMARTDTDHGVWKAPAGVSATIAGTTGLTYTFTDLENGILNKRGINTIRIFPNGIVNWGARTLDGDDMFASEFKYIPVRRLALYIEESLYRGLAWAVFEPNDQPLWTRVRLHAGTFMNALFREGAFQGVSDREAYFVKCGPETTTQSDISNGILNIEVGFAPLKPAEFVVLRLQQIAGQR